MPISTFCLERRGPQRRSPVPRFTEDARARGERRQPPGSRGAAPESLLGVAGQACPRRLLSIVGRRFPARAMQKWNQGTTWRDFSSGRAENRAPFGRRSSRKDEVCRSFTTPTIDDRQPSRPHDPGGAARLSPLRRFLNRTISGSSTSRRDFFIDTADCFRPRAHSSARRKAMAAWPGQRKVAGLLSATQIGVRSRREFADALATHPDTRRAWYLTSDGILTSSNTTSFEDLYNRSTSEDRIRCRREYPHVIQVFKNSHFSPGRIVQGLSLALDRPFADSAHREELEPPRGPRRRGVSPGKYKSLFLANQGAKAERLSALLDAVAGSTVGLPGRTRWNTGRSAAPRRSRGDGAFSCRKSSAAASESTSFRPSRGCVLEQRVPMVRRASSVATGLVRLVPGLGTRAVDRPSPTISRPRRAGSKPGLRVNVTEEEIARYSPRQRTRRHRHAIGNFRRRRGRSAARGMRPGRPGRRAPRLPSRRERIHPGPVPHRLECAFREAVVGRSEGTPGIELFPRRAYAPSCAC